MKDEKLFPIGANPQFCVRCERCMYSCSPKAIFFRDSLRYVNYDKCKGCLKCVEVCEHGAVEVISIEEGKLKGFEIDPERCVMCKQCLEEGFCFQQLYKLEKDAETGEEKIVFDDENISECFKCLKCFKSCPNNAIMPKID